MEKDLFDIYIIVKFLDVKDKRSFLSIFKEDKIDNL